MASSPVVIDAPGTFVQRGSWRAFLEAFWSVLPFLYVYVNHESPHILFVSAGEGPDRLHAEG